MARLNRDKFKEEQKSRQNFGKRITNWKKDGETIGWIHPKMGVHYRYSHGMFSLPNSGGGTDRFKYSAPVICLGKEREDIPRIDCPFCSLGVWAKDMTSKHQAESAILECGEGKEFRSYTLSDLAGGKNVEYQKRIQAKFDGMIAWIKKDTKVEDMKEAVELLQAPNSLVDKIIDTIEEQVSMRGSPMGDPLIPDGFQLRMKKGKLVLVSENNELEWNPYAFKFRYNGKEIPANQYKVTKIDIDILPLTPEIMQIMMAEEDELDLNFANKEEPTDAHTQLGMIKSIWSSRVIPFETFLKWYQERSGKVIEPKESTKPTETSAPASPPPSAPADSGKQFKCVCGSLVVPMKPSNRCPECGVKMTLDDVPF